MLLVFPIAFFTKTEVVASIAVKSEFSTIDGFLAAIADKPSIILAAGFLLLNLLIDLLLYGLCYLSFILFWVNFSSIVFVFFKINSIFH